MELTSYCKVLRAVGSYINLRGHGTRLSGSIAARVAEDTTLARSDPIDLTPSVQCSREEDCLSREEPNRTILVRQSSPLLHVEKTLLPLYVLNFYLEEAILKRFSDHNQTSKSETPLVNTVHATSITQQYSSTTTAVEFKEMMKQMIKTEKSTSPPHVSRTNTDDKDVNKGGLLPFVTKLLTFPQQGVPPQAGFASTTEKTVEKLSHEVKMKTTPVIESESITKLGKGITDAKGKPTVEGSVHDGSFSKVTHVNIFEKGLVSNVASKTSTGKKDAVLNTDGGVDSSVKAASRNMASAQEFLKYQTVSPTDALPEPVVDRRAEAEMKACAVVTQKGSLRDAQTLIEFSKSGHAPRSLMNLKESVECQYNDQKTLMLLQKYKLLKLREVEYHNAQIKKHRKVLLELLFKTPYQKPQDPSKPP